MSEVPYDKFVLFYENPSIVGYVGRINGEDCVVMQYRHLNALHFMEGLFYVFHEIDKFSTQVRFVSVLDLQNHGESPSFGSLLNSSWLGMLKALILRGRINRKLVLVGFNKVTAIIARIGWKVFIGGAVADVSFVQSWDEAEQILQ